jgi:hypothetical protein
MHFRLLHSKAFVCVKISFSNIVPQKQSKSVGEEYGNTATTRVHRALPHRIYEVIIRF